MAQREILTYPDPALTRMAAPVEDFGEDFQKLVDDLLDTMGAQNAIGLSAPQFGEAFRVLVIRPDPTEPAEVFVNPVIGAKAMWGFVEESCLSIPGVVGSVMRATRIQVSARDRHGTVFERDLSGMHAVCVQHETDHLNGKLFIDKFTAFGRMRARRKAARFAREQAA